MIRVWEHGPGFKSPAYATHEQKIPIKNKESSTLLPVRAKMVSRKQLSGSRLTMFSRLRRAVSSESAGALNSDIQRVAGSSQHTREAASEMQQVTAAQQFLVQTYARDTGAIA